MPIYYNQQSPTPTTKNTITSVAIGGIRDFLLNKNLLPSSMIPAGYPINTAINGSPRVGEPVLDTLVGSGANVVPNHLPLETEGLIWKNLNVLPNTFKNTDTTANDLIGIYYVQDTTFTSKYDGITNFGTAEWPQGIQSYPDGIENYGLLAKTNNAQFKLQNVKSNLYLDETKQIDVAAFIVKIPGNITQQFDGYLETYGDVSTGDVDKYGSLNLGQGNDVNVANTIGSVITGQGLGLAKAGIVNNFDIRSSLAGRVLGATGSLNDTKLGTIGGQQLALALANNAAFNIQQDILGKLNIKDNVLSLAKGNGLADFRPNYSITIPEGGVGRSLDYVGKVLGFTLPRSYMNDEGSIFQSETGEVDNVTRANMLLKTTGKGQLKALIENVKANQIGTSPKGYDNPKYTNFRTGYAPGYYLDNKGNERITDGILYAFGIYGSGLLIDLFCTTDSSGKGESTIPVLNYDRNIADYGFKGPEELEFVGHTSERGYDEKTVNSILFSWGTEEEGIVNSNPNYSNVTGNRKSLLTKTQKLFNSNGMKTIVTAKGDMNKTSSQLEQANGFGFSKGNAVMSEIMFDTKLGIWKREKNHTADETYCRSWTTLDRYDTIDPSNRSGLVRSSKFYDDNKVPFRFDSNVNSVLEDTGFVKIAPYTNDFLNPDVPRAAKNYMLSIENLAWADSDSITKLPKGEQGLGDPLSGKKGRIMWFPPYDIQISESVNVDWEAHKFIGRGENVYTYSNTERTGQLSFKIIVDHPTYMNTFRGQNGPDDHYVASFIAGCIEPDSLWTDKFTVQQASKIVTSTQNIPQPKVAPPEPPKISPLRVYFPNDIARLNGDMSGYENGKSGSTDIDYTVNADGKGCGIGPKKGEVTSNTEWPDGYNYGLNYSINSSLTPTVTINDKIIRGFEDPQYYTELISFMKEKGKFCFMETVGFASPQGRSAANEELANSRAKYLRDLLVEKVGKHLGLTAEQLEKKIKANVEKSKEAASKQVTIGYTIENGVVKKVCPDNNGVGCKTIVKGATLSDSGCLTCPKTGALGKASVRAVVCPPDTKGCKLDRFAEVRITYDAAAALAATAPPPDCIETTQNEVTTTIKEKFYNETMFFDKLQKTDKFIFDKFREKIRYFHPAFHSTTPEGLNSRLTFLHQCTRQGPTLEGQGANNLAFGRPPICILRIGDFFYTKVAFDSLSIEYEPLVWDLNPEGIGVQPMIANVSLGFKFIGAESLYGPINKLQNALSFNFYANTRVYEARADYFSQGKPAGATTADTNTDLYLHNGESSVNPVSETMTKKLSEKNSCDVDQIKGSETTIKNENAVNGTETNSTTSGTTSGYTAFDIQKCMSLVSVDIDESYNVSVVLKFVPTKDITEFMIGVPNQNFEGIFYLVSNDTNKQLPIGYTYFKKNNDDTMLIFYEDRTSKFNKVVRKKTPVENIEMKFIIPQENAEFTEWVDKLLKEPQPMFKIKWSLNEGFINSVFPYKQINK